MEKAPGIDITRIAELATPVANAGTLATTERGDGLFELLIALSNRP